jgi:hypothetical protein
MYLFYFPKKIQAAFLSLSAVWFKLFSYFKNLLQFVSKGIINRHSAFWRIEYYRRSHLHKTILYDVGH